MLRLLFVLIFRLWQDPTKENDLVLVHVNFFDDLVHLLPWLALDAYQSDQAFTLHQHHDVGACFHFLAKYLLVDHLRVSDKAYKLPLTEVDELLGSVLRKVNDTDLFVVWCEALVRKQWVLDVPGLRYRSLRVRYALLLARIESCREE